MWHKGYTAALIFTCSFGYLLSVEHSGVAEVMAAHLLCARRGGVVVQHLLGCGLLGCGRCVVVGVGVSSATIVEPR